MSIDTGLFKNIPLCFSVFANKLYYFYSRKKKRITEVLFCGTGNLIQGLAHARKVFYH
jgi:hypothetical protein